MTTPTPVDVNDRFAQTRRDQIAYAQDAPRRAEQAAADRRANFDQRIKDGKLRSLGGGRYKVTDPDSFDDGEILRAQFDTVTQQVVILPQHGLDETDGKVALYTAAPPWHELGNYIPGGLTDVDQVLELAGCNWPVELVPAGYNWNGEWHVNPDKWHTVNGKTGDPLGVVGRKYANGGVVQNRQLAELLQDLVMRYNVPWESMGSMRGGRKVFVSMRLPDTVTIDAGGVNDQIVPFVVAINSHDGDSRLVVVVTPWRPVCANTERFAVRDALTRWEIRHTSTATERLAEARRTLQLSSDYFDSYVVEETQLAQTDLEIDEFNKVIDDVFAFNREDEREAVRHETRRAKLLELWERNTARLGATAYAGERAITEFLDHWTPARACGQWKGKPDALRATRIVEGAYDEAKNRAHKRMMAIIR